MSFKQTLGKVLKDSLTGIDGETYDGVKVVGYPCWLLAILVYIGAALKDVGFHATSSLDFQNYATGITTLFGSLLLIAAGVALKKSTEPTGNQNPPTDPNNQTQINTHI